MSRTSWRSLACLLCLSLGGIVVCAEERSAESAGFPPRSAVTAVPPAIADVAISAPEIEPVAAPTVAPVMAVSPDPLPEPAPQVVAPIEHEPAVRPAPIPLMPDAPAVHVPLPPKPTPAVGNVTPEVPEAVPAPVAPPAPMPITLVATPAPTPAPTPVAPAATKITPDHSFPWRLKLEMVGGLTQLDICRGDELQLRVQCERLDLQTPSGGLQASGKVRVSGPCVEACGDRLSIVWATGHIAMEGHVRLICQNGQQKTELGAESIVFRLIGGGAGIEVNARAVSSQLTGQ